MLPVLLLFLLPVGGGIPGGVLLAKQQGLGWALTGALYLLSDLILALTFEPLLRGLLALGRRSPALVRVSAALGEAMDRLVTQVGGRGAGPLTLVLISFGVDPMTGRAAALAAGHGPLAGWALAITGDLLYYAVIAAATLKLDAALHHPQLTVGLMLAAMLLLPALVRTLRTRWAPSR